MWLALIAALAAQADAPLVEPTAEAPAATATEPPPAAPSTTTPDAPAAPETPSTEAEAEAPALKPGRARKPKPYALTALPLSAATPETAALASTLTASWWASLAENGDVRVREGQAPCVDDACAAQVGGEVVWGTVGQDERDGRLYVVDLHLYEADAERSIRRIRLDAPDEETLRAQLHEAAYLLVDSVPPQRIPATVIAGGAVAGVGLLGALGAGAALGWSAYAQQDASSSSTTKAQARAAQEPGLVALAVSGGVFVVGAGLVLFSLP